MGWLIGGIALYLLYTNGALGTLGARPRLATQLTNKLPGGFTIGLPIPSGWRVWQFPDGSQIIIQPGAPTGPGGWVQGTKDGAPVWFNEQTGQVQQ